MMNNVLYNKPDTDTETHHLSFFFSLFDSDLMPLT